MTISKFEIEEAAKKVDQLKAHADCIDKIKCLDSLIKRSDNRNIKLIKRGNKRIEQVNKLEQELESLKQKSLNRLIEVDSLKAENAKLELELSELKAALLGWQDSIEK